MGVANDLLRLAALRPKAPCIPDSELDDTGARLFNSHARIIRE
jgi:hypothetical protein